MSVQNPRSVVVTGAGRGIGAALARAYAAQGVAMLLVGRDAGRLEGIAAECAARGAAVETAAVDVTEVERLAAALVAFDAAHAVDLVIANAGVSGGLEPQRRFETFATAQRQLRINLEGAIATVAPLVEPMRARKRGQIALMSSLAALQPVGDTAAYSASKAGILAWGEALGDFLAGDGIAVSVICPGFVTSDMSARYGGPKPFEMSADDAAALIRRKLAAQKPVIAFPWQMVAAIRVGRILPRAVRRMILGRVPVDIAPDRHG
ncbi:SDR family NAD(P)-dependent oxidoreductase [Hansschlegelia zhihuaiae]|uniref:SDR family NAD(P)-dependent oxidoreductase n=1 Tax=Hansschlegelia zhihuaiae TaxID=405005 RepID=A0A4Q0M663_9HYPH|nr:SDR family NAD(P)-dependent oxidoreductase [Hansschlegelia zhihuaiae]RXF68531.1 SDR family NAD(P)-dependent oxidoreductase [Hansschlegelia zhihuaiae]